MPDGSTILYVILWGIVILEAILLVVLFRAVQQLRQQLKLVATKVGFPRLLE